MCVCVCVCVLVNGVRGFGDADDARLFVVWRGARPRCIIIAREDERLWSANYFFENTSNIILEGLLYELINIRIIQKFSLFLNILL